jgi:riboflavin synthase
MGKITELDLEEKWGRIALETTPWQPAVEIGESIAVQGICLTVAEKKADTMYFDILRETFDRTTLGQCRTGDSLNLERALKWGDPMGGHIVVGHIDGVGSVVNIEQVGRDWKYEFTCSEELMAGMVFKGSVSIDGISLTIAELRQESFVVHIIPHTWEVTTFQHLKPGDPVNLEIDLLSKFVRRLVERGKMPTEVTWQALRETGLIDEPVPEE